MSRATLELTPDQLRAVTAVGTSVIVSASAGSGKTRVLSERCAYLVCDAPPPHRCDVDALLVLTFTDAAAAEMRSRIVEAIRRRAADDPRLARQVLLADAAQISTIHSFCLWMIRRWFTELDIDPAATVMDAEEAKLLRKDVLERLFERLYAATAVPDDPLGKDRLHAPPASPPPFDFETWRLGARSIEALSTEFIHLVEHYGLGEDGPISTFVLRLHEFTRSLVEPDEWMTSCVTRLSPPAEGVLREWAAALRVELGRQAEFCARCAADIESGPPVGHFYAAKIRDYETNLRRWTSDLGELPDPTALERVRAAIDAYKFPAGNAPPLKKDKDTHLIEQRKPAQETYSKKIQPLFKDRLQPRFGRSSIAEMREHLAATAGPIAALVELVKRFGEEYTAAKQRWNVLDFSDLEQLALKLLRETPNIAEELRRRFTHVLVDEFQDINPVQQEILRLVSRESGSGDTGNLFVVGDVKQSIYRFRLAEPGIFAERVERFRKKDGGEALFLQHNFRSEPPILDAVNRLFRRLMGDDLGPTPYDDLAELRPGNPADATTPRRPVELHLLEKKRVEKDEDSNGDESEEDDGSGSMQGNPPGDWSAIEREAYLIALKIEELRADAPSETPVHYKDIAVLLRSTKINAERVAHVLSMLGIPAFAEIGGSLFSAMEVRDVIAALEVIDNQQQDIPWVGVLRGGFFGQRFTEDELVDIRCVDIDLPFHQAVRVRSHQDDRLGRRLRDVRSAIGRYRGEARRRPLAEVLQHLYDETAYLAYAGGLPNGAQRRANLLKLHTLARQFGVFRRQGLHRFLRFIRSLADEEQELAVAPTLGESEDVVRIMSVHHAKGLEFPIVFLAGLGSAFNLRDRRGRMLFERNARVGLRVVDPNRRIEFPSPAHRLVVDEIERTARSEEMRILYVATTRAKERLFLIASSDDFAEKSPPFAKGGLAGERTPTAFEIATAQSPLDWLHAAITDDPIRSVFTIHPHTFDEMDAWRLDRVRDPHESAVRTAVAQGDLLPNTEPLAPDDRSVEEVLNRLTWVYPHAPATAQPATLGARDWARISAQSNQIAIPHASAASFPSVAPSLSRSVASFPVPPSKYATTAEPAIQRGLITHRVLQHLDFHRAKSPDGLASELQRMSVEGLAADADRRWVDEGALAWLIETTLADRIRSIGDRFRREFRFLCTEEPPDLDSPAPQDRVLVRGIIDGILDRGETLDVLDYKTDAITEEQVETRAAEHRPTIALYARAVERLWRKPVTKCSLVFLTPRRIVEWSP